MLYIASYVVDKKYDAEGVGYSEEEAIFHARKAVESLRRLGKNVNKVVNDEDFEVRQVYPGNGYIDRQISNYPSDAALNDSHVLARAIEKNYVTTFNLLHGVCSLADKEGGFSFKKPVEIAQWVHTQIRLWAETVRKNTDKSINPPPAIPVIPTPPETPCQNKKPESTQYFLHSLSGSLETGSSRTTG